MHLIRNGSIVSADDNRKAFTDLQSVSANRRKLTLLSLPWSPLAVSTFDGAAASSWCTSCSCVHCCKCVPGNEDQQEAVVSAKDAGQEDRGGGSPVRPRCLVVDASTGGRHVG